MIDWKYTAAVTGLTLAGAWVAGTPVSRPETVPPAARAAAQADAPVTDIESQALRLQARVRVDGNPGTLPEGRNPFRFVRSGTASRITAPVAATEELASTEMPVLASTEPDLKLIGMATDESAAGTSRTAILKTPSDVVLVELGDSIDDLYRVTAIDADAVEVTTSDGASRRLSLRP